MKAERIMERYHFEKADEDRIIELSAVLECEAEIKIQYKEGGFPYGDVLAGITMGEGPDRLCERWMREGNLTDAYLADCILCEMMADAYDVFRDRFHNDTGKYIARMKFIGDAGIPAGHLLQALRMLDMKEIRCTSGGMMAPSKSVVFYAVVSAQKPEGYFSACAECGNTGCERRTGFAKNI